MRKISFRNLIVAALSLFVVGAASAATIGFSPASQTVAVGDSLAVDLVISDLDGEIVSAYDLDVTYDASILSATNVTFGPFLGDEFFFEVFNDFDLSGPGVVDLAQLSLLSDFELALMQPDSFVLATLEFDAVGLGTSSLDFVFDAPNGIQGRDALPLDIAAQSGSASVVPEPGAALLFVVGGVVFGRAIKRARSLSEPAA